LEDMKMKVPVSLTLEYEYLIHLKKECRLRDIKFNDYVAAALAVFLSPKEYAAQKEREEDDRLERKSTTPISQQVDETTRQG
jgi:hypothetical protein